MANSPLPTFRSAYVILLALEFGLLCFTGAAIIVRLNGLVAQPVDGVETLVWVIGFLFVSSGASYIVLRQRFLARVQASKEEALAAIQQDRLPFPLYFVAIVGAALAEGPGLLGAVVYLLGGPVYVLAAPALSIIVIALLLPSRERTEEMVRELARE